MIDLKEIADNADMIIDGYAFTKEDNIIRAINLYKPEKASVISENDKIIETNMDDIELSILLNYYERNKEFLGESVYA